MNQALRSTTCLLAALLLSSTCAYAQVTYRVRLTAAEGGKIVELPAEHYVAAVLAGEASTFRNVEALKAAAVAARSYAAYTRSRHANEGFDFCSTTHCQRIVLKDITPRLEEIAAQTRGLLLWYKARPAFTVYTRNCGGRSESAASFWPEIAAPYLRSHSDPYCLRSRADAWSAELELEQISSALQSSALRAPQPLEAITVLNRDESGRTRILQLAGRSSSISIQAGSIQAGSFRLAIGRALGWNRIRSDLYEIRKAGSRVQFRGRGEGHGIGLCQNGAEQMAAEGHSYKDILSFYYPGTVLAKRAPEPAWKQVDSGTLTLFTTHPERDNAMLPVAVQALIAAQETTSIAAHAKPRVYLYPDMETFRNVTGEPGWVAARAVDLRIDLQPPAVLRSGGILERTLRHEFLHVLLEQTAAPSLPLWFREGLVGALSGDAAPVVRPSSPEESGSGIGNRQNQEQSRTAYRQARVRVEGLIARYGKAAVLGWVKDGIPLAVLQASKNNMPLNNK